MAKNNVQDVPVLPIGNKVLVELILEAETSGGLQLPVKEVKSGIVVAIGPLVPTELLSKDSKVIPEFNSRGIRLSDKVFLPKGDRVGDKFESGERKFLLVPIDYIGGILPS